MHAFKGNHTFAAIRGCESYQLIGALSEVIGEVNSLVTSRSLPAVPGVTFEVILGGDYKVEYCIIVHSCLIIYIIMSYTSNVYYTCVVCTYVHIIN